MSEEIPAGAAVTFDILCLVDDYVDVVKEWLNYGQYSGIAASGATPARAGLPGKKSDIRNGLGPKRNAEQRQSYVMQGAETMSNGKA